ncbi:ornithine decarboxylase antizyme 2 [Columba livia]|uniref:Ornithine decarboxylase antizyme 2 n=1 Tax=Columba livia TaxID=8932 RepID=A0A2I0LP00_COLLI|nr:ornithine decarboxylase antizyme 2 [Columba livia]
MCCLENYISTCNHQIVQGGVEGAQELSGCDSGSPALVQRWLLQTRWSFPVCAHLTHYFGFHVIFHSDS